MDELLRLPSCAGDKSSSLRYVYDKISVHVRGLEALGVSSKEYGSLLIPILMSKLPNDLRMRIARESKGEVWKIDELIETLRVEIEVREASERFKIGERQKQGENPTRRVPQTTGSTLLSRESGEFKVNWAYCYALHYSASCQSVTDPAKRKAILSQAKRCFNCLRQGHGLRTVEAQGFVETMVRVITNLYVARGIHRAIRENALTIIRIRTKKLKPKGEQIAPSLRDLKLQTGNMFFFRQRAP